MIAIQMRRARLSLGVFLGLAVLAAGAAPAAAGGELRGHHGGEAWGTRANAVADDIAVKLGRTAFQQCPCKGTDGAIVSNSIDTIRAGDDGDVFSASTALSTAQADKLAGGTAYTTLVSTIENVRALDGLVTADLIRARAKVTATASGFATTSEGSKILGLRVLGQPISVSLGERVDIAGFGYLILKDVDRGGDGVTRRSIKVEMMRIIITRNNPLDIPIGSKITVGHAQAVYSRLHPVGLVGGAAFAADAVSSLPATENRVGRAAMLFMGCVSKGTVNRTNNIEQLDAPGILTSGTGVTTLFGQVNAEHAVAKGVARIENLNLLDGLVRADVIRGTSRTERLANGSRTASYAGSMFVNLRVAGIAIGDDVEPNTEIDVPGVGSLVLFETQTAETADEIRAQVIMVHLTVDVALNPFDLPVGTEVRVALARTKVETP